MIISRTPFRVSFFGGGSDYASWHEENQGMVLSTTIDKYCYVSCRYFPPFFDHKSRVVWSKIENVQNFGDIQHPAIREILKYFDIKEGLEIMHNADLPARSGLGSSSSFVVGLLSVLYALQGKMVTKRQLALDAIKMEQEILKENVGLQDQTAAAFGGFNKITFGGPEKIQVAPIAINSEVVNALQDHLMLFFTGFSRTASEIAGEQIQNTKHKKQEIGRMVGMVEESIGILNRGKDLKDFGKLLDESWQLKRGLSSQITNKDIDEIYTAAREAGALGGKLLGAGGGGFMLIFAEPAAQPKIKAKLHKLLHVPFRFESLGSQIVYYAPSKPYASK
jgi:D-glycero-alpha-D-manno-heptose-7-phosphate kinase